MDFNAKFLFPPQKELFYKFLGCFRPSISFRFNRYESHLVAAT